MVADRFFASARRMALAAPGLPVSGLLASGRMAMRHGPVLLPSGDGLGRPARHYVAAHRDRLVGVDLVGRHLPYAVEAGVQRALLS